MLLILCAAMAGEAEFPLAPSCDCFVTHAVVAPIREPKVVHDGQRQQNAPHDSVIWPFRAGPMTLEVLQHNQASLEVALAHRALTYFLQEELLGFAHQERKLILQVLTQEGASSELELDLLLDELLEFRSFERWKLPPVGHH